jgi:hypothetical protein
MANEPARIITDPDEVVGKELIVTVGQEQKYGAEDGVMDNPVKGVKPLSDAVANASSLL